MLHRALALAFVALLSVGAPATSAQPAPPFGSQAKDWLTLGHLAPLGATAVAVSPDWPRERLLVAVRGDALVQTTDGGESWQAVGSLPPGDTRMVVDLVLAGPANARVLFLQTSRALYRSTDRGGSWVQLVSSESPYDTLTVRWSPDLVHDGLVLALSDGVLSRSRDFGASWDQLDPAAGEVVQDVVFSPAYARDHQLFVAVAGGTFAINAAARKEYPGADHDSSLGVLGSTDAGDSWTEHNAGFEVDGEPYLAVQTLAISPTFAQDGTLFAVAWGPQSETQYYSTPATQQARALFVSHDRAASWSVLQPMSAALWAATEFFALSPTFAADGVALWAHSVRGPSPASSNCTVSRTADGGASWDTVLPAATYGGCHDLAMFHSAGHRLAVVDKDSYRHWSADGGQSWSTFDLNPAYGYFGQLPFVVALGNGDQALFAVAPYNADGVYGLNTGTPATSGSLACQFGTQLGFERVYRARAEARNLLGCPTAPESNVSFRLSTAQVGTITERGFWPIDDSPDYYLANSDSYVTRLEKVHGWLYRPSSERVVDGTLQPFEDGTRMLFVPGEAGQPGKIVVIGIQRWLEFDDTP